MLYLEERCPICTTGNIGFWLCSDQSTLVVLCDECDSVWLDPELVLESNALFPQPPDFLVPNHAFSISAPKSRWATLREVEVRGWGGRVAGQGKAMDERD
jgi:Zn-finger nucleic acid-binding protein